MARNKRSVRYLRVKYDLLPINVLREMGDGCPFCRSDKTFLVVHSVQHGFDADSHLALGECMGCGSHFGAVWQETKGVSVSADGHTSDIISRNAFETGDDK